MKHHNSPIGRKLTGPQIARRGAAHIQRNHAKPGRDWMGGRSPSGGEISPADTAMPAPGGAMPMGPPPPPSGGPPEEGMGGL